MIAAIVLSGCAAQQPGDSAALDAQGTIPTYAGESETATAKPLMTLDEYPITQGSNPTRIISEALFTHFTGLDDITDDYFKICHTGTTQAYRDFLGEDEDIEMIIAQQPDPVTERKLQGTQFKPIAKDALVFITSKSNPIDSLTLDQIKHILSGQITNWKEVGGNDEPINIIKRNETGGSQILLDKYVLKGSSIKELPEENITNDMSEMSLRVARNNENGSTLGYTTYYFAKFSGKRDDIKILEINGVQAGNESLQDETYPLIAYIYIGVKDIDSPAGSIFKWITTPDGQALVSETGYVPLN